MLAAVLRVNAYFQRREGEREPGSVLDENVIWKTVKPMFAGLS
jgi:hypothetical protein